METEQQRWERELKQATDARDTIFREMAPKHKSLSYNECALYEAEMEKQAKRIATARAQLTRLKNGRVA